MEDILLDMSGTKPEPSPTQVSKLLRAAAQGEPMVAEQLLPLVYDQLRALAQKYMRGERTGHTLQATALVHEAYLRLVQNDQIDWKGRGHFYIAAADAMRRVLIDHARKHGAVKRGGDWSNVTLNLAELVAGKGLNELLLVDEALDELTAADPRTAQVVRLRFFAGLEVDEAARVLGVSPRTVDREWQYARAWLKRRLNDSCGREAEETR
jgi:RNA polymerase sigma factor (TIGR02999 family)